jgi:hypothetical protein
MGLVAIVPRIPPPHQGPSLSIGPGGTYHATWLALGNKRKGLYYARSLDGGATFSAPMPLGDAAHQNTRPYVLAGPDAVTLAYKAFDAIGPPSRS